MGNDHESQERGGGLRGGGGREEEGEKAEGQRQVKDKEKNEVSVTEMGCEFPEV